MIQKVLEKKIIQDKKKSRLNSLKSWHSGGGVAKENIKINHKNLKVKFISRLLNIFFFEHVQLLYTNFYLSAALFFYD